MSRHVGWKWGLWWVLTLLVAGAAGADVDLVVRPAVRTHTEHITKSPHTFSVTADADGFRPFSRNSIPDDVLQWVQIEGPARNPKLLVEGLPDLSSADALLGAVLHDGETPAEKALALYTAVARFAVYTSSPSRSTWGMDDPIIGLNCGAGICGDFTVWMKALAWQAGLPARTYELTRHTVPEVFYAGRWHMFDPTTVTFFIGRDNRTVADVRELEQNPDLLRRAGASDRNLSFYVPPGNNRLGGHSGHTGCRMDVTLRPGEALTRKTFQDGPSLWNYQIDRAQRYASGSLVYRPDLSHGRLDEILKTHANLTQQPHTFPALRPKAPRVPALATFNVASPYPITKATLTGEFGRCAEASTFEIFITAHAPGMTTWRRPVLTLDETGPPGEHTIDLTPFVFGTYSYDVEFRMTSTALDEPTGIHLIAFENTLQLNRYALPQLTGGENRVTYTDDGPHRDVTVTFNFEEKHPLQVTPWPPMAGRPCTLRARVRNDGNTPADKVEVLFEQRWRREPLKKTVVIDRIEPGGVGTAELSWTPDVPRATWFRVTADPDGRIAEADREDNSYTRGFRVLGSADLSVTPSQITVEKRGGRAHLEALVINVGGLPARDIEVAFLTGDGDTGTEIARAAVPVVHSTAFTSESVDCCGWAKSEVPEAALTGTHVGVKIDPDGKLDEDKRTNNLAWVEVARAGRRTPPPDEAADDPLVFFSFEPGTGELRDAELHGSPRAREVEQHATHGKQALELTFPAGKHTGLRIPYDGTDVPMPRSWEGCRALLIDVLNDTDQPATLIVQLTTHKAPRTRLRAEALRRAKARATMNAHFLLPPRKPVTLEVDLTNLPNLANLRAVEQLALMSTDPTRHEPPLSRDVTMFVDNLRLVRAERPTTLPRISSRDRSWVSQDLGVNVAARPIRLSSEDELACFTGVHDVEIADDFGAPGLKRGAKFTVRRERSVGMTLDLTASDGPWPMDWSGYRRLCFHARRASGEPFTVSLKLRSSHPEHGVKFVSRSFALREGGARYDVDLKETAGRIDLDSMTHVTWFVWRPQFEGTFWLGGLELEK